LHAQWGKTLLRVELAELRDQGFDLELMGFAAEDAIVGGPDPRALRARVTEDVGVVSAQYVFWVAR
jgi:hypothetical protein